MAKAQTLQDPFLNALRKENIPVSSYLFNGSKLQGRLIRLISLSSYSKTQSIKWYINMLYQRSFLLAMLILITKNRSI